MEKENVDLSETWWTILLTCFLVSISVPNKHPFSARKFKVHLFAHLRKVKVLQKFLPFRKEYKFIVSPKIVRNWKWRKYWKHNKEVSSLPLHQLLPRYFPRLLYINFQENWYTYTTHVISKIKYENEKNIR